MNRPTVALHGAAYGGNFGDVLILRLLADAITRRTNAFVELPFARPRFNRDYRPEWRWPYAKRQPAAAVWGPGGYMGERPFALDSWVQRLLSYHGQFWRYLDERKLPSMVYGVGVGPLTNPEARQFILRIFERAEIAFVRDEESLQYLKEYGADTTDVEVVPDIAISISVGDMEAQTIAKTRASLSGGHYPSVIGLHLPDIADQESEGWKMFVRDLGPLVDRHPESRFVLFNDGPGRSDGPAPLVLRALAGKKNVVTAGYRGTESLRYRLAAMDSIITTKLHVGICAYGLGKIPVSVFIHTKVPRFYRQIGLPHLAEPIHEYRPGWVFDALPTSLKEGPNSGLVRADLKTRVRGAVDKLTNAVHGYC